MKPSPQAKRGLCWTVLQVLEWQLSYHFLHSLRAPVAYVFWLIEQHKAWLPTKGGSDERRETN